MLEDTLESSFPTDTHNVSLTSALVFPEKPLFDNMPCVKINYSNYLWEARAWKITLYFIYFHTLTVVRKNLTLNRFKELGARWIWLLNLEMQ